MAHSETMDELVALHKMVGRTLADARARYFDPEIVLELCRRWTPVRDALRSEFPSILGELCRRTLHLANGENSWWQRKLSRLRPLVKKHRSSCLGKPFHVVV